MTAEEAKKVAQIASTTDGGCPSCAAQLVVRLERAWPEHGGVFRGAYDSAFPDEERDWAEEARYA